jgi:hypothetical protein
VQFGLLVQKRELGQRNDQAFGIDAVARPDLLYLTDDVLLRRIVRDGLELGLREHSLTSGDYCQHHDDRVWQYRAYRVTSSEI